MYIFRITNKLLEIFNLRLIRKSKDDLLMINYIEANKNTKIHSFISSLKAVSHAPDLIRIGSEYDGGYLVPNDLKGIYFCYSLGVGNNSDFEDQLAIRGIHSYLADYTVFTSPSSNPNLHFTKKYIGVLNNADTMRLQTWIEANEFDNDMILKMDIEGDEYNVIIDTPHELLNKFRCLIIEFHNFDLLGVDKHFEIITASFSKILDDFNIVHIHPNNCGGRVSFDSFSLPRVMEFAFLRKDRFSSKMNATTIPHVLDRKNCKDQNDIFLPNELSL